MKNKISTRSITMVALFSAACGVLGAVSLDLGNLKITFESLPVLIMAYGMGPLPGALVGGIGTLLYQVLRYGFSVTTILWILPYIIMGLFSGALYGKKIIKSVYGNCIFITLLSSLLVLVLNTGSIYIDSKIYGYYTAVYVFGSFILRFIIAIVRSIAFGIIIPVIFEKTGKLFYGRKN